MFGSHLRNERKTERRDEQFGDREEEIEHDQHPRARFQPLLGRRGHFAKFRTRGIPLDERIEGQEEIGQSGQAHADGDFARRRNLLSAFCQRSEEPHDQRGQDDDEERIDRLPDFGRDHIGSHEVAREDRERSPVLVEREPEKDRDPQHGEKGVHALFDLLRHPSLLLGSVADGLLPLLFARIGKALLAHHEDKERNEHGGHRRDERIVDTRIENFEILLAESAQIVRNRAARLRNKGVEVVDHLARHAVGGVQILVAERRELGVVTQIVDVEPPAAQHRCDERGNQSADIDEDVEDLEARIALRGIARIVVKLTDDRLEIALEKAVAESNEEKGATRQRQQPGRILRRGQNRDGEHAVTERHDDQTADDRPLVILRAVGDQAADQTEHIDTGVEERVDQRAFLFAQTELRAEEEHQHRIHNVIAEALAHVAQGSGNQPFGMVFEHSPLGI